MDKTVLGIISATVLVLGGVIVASNLSPNNQPALGEEIELQPATHITVGESHPVAYSSNPPTSGWHYASPAEWGASAEVIVDEIAIHNLEHGGVWISYRPDRVDQATIDQLTTLVRGYPSKVILSPRAANDSPIAVASWGRLLTLDQFDENQLRQFIDRNKNKGPERIPD